MKKYLFILIAILIPTLAHAENFVCFDAQNNFSSKTQGDCRTLGICSGLNNTGINPRCIIASQQEYDIASRFTEFDGSVVTGSRVVPMLQGEIDTILAADAAQVEASLRTDSKAQFNGNNTTALGLRCEAKAILDEINTLRTFTRDLKAAIAASTTLAQVKTNVAALATLNDRTLTQAKTAIQNCVDLKQADE